MTRRIPAFLLDRRFLVAALLAAVFFGNQGFRGLIANWRELRGLRGQIARLEREEAQLRRRAASVKQGGVEIERLARSELGFGQSGEVEYRFPPPKK